MPVQTTAQPPLSEEELKQYEGKWIAFEGDEVLAAADSIEELSADPKVKAAESKSLYHVPAPSTLYY